MKKSVYSSFLLLFFTFAVVIGYQNCGAVGGTSPFNSNPGIDDDDNGDFNNPALLRLSAQTPKAIGRMLTVNFSCDYSTFLNHKVYIQVTGPNNFSEIWDTSCTAYNFTYTRTMQASFNPAAHSYQLQARLVAYVGSEEVTHANATVNPIAIVEGIAFPTTITSDWQDLNTLSGSNSQTVNILGNVPGTYSPYIGVVGRIEFTASSALPLDTVSNTYYGLFEFLPYRDNTGGFRSEFAFSMIHRVQNTTYRYDGLYHPSGIRPTAVFEVGAVYVIDFRFDRLGPYSFNIYKKSNTTIGLYQNGNIGFSNVFGTEAMQVKWGKNINSTASHSGFTNAKLKYRVCGYVGGAEDLGCLSFITE